MHQYAHTIVAHDYCCRFHVSHVVRSPIPTLVHLYLRHSVIVVVIIIKNVSKCTATHDVLTKRLVRRRVHRYNCIACYNMTSPEHGCMYTIHSFLIIIHDLRKRRRVINKITRKTLMLWVYVCCCATPTVIYTSHRIKSAATVRGVY